MSVSGMIQPTTIAVSLDTETGKKPKRRCET